MAKRSSKPCGSCDLVNDCPDCGASELEALRKRIKTMEKALLYLPMDILDKRRAVELHKLANDSKWRLTMEIAHGVPTRDAEHFEHLLNECRFWAQRGHFFLPPFKKNLFDNPDKMIQRLKDYGFGVHVEKWKIPEAYEETRNYEFVLIDWCKDTEDSTTKVQVQAK